MSRLLILVLTIVVVACGGGQMTDPGDTEPPPDAPVDLGEKPEVDVLDGPAPSELAYRDLVEGEGPVAEPDAVVTVHYVGVQWSDGEQFDASWDRGVPLQRPLEQLIDGWRIGVAGDATGDVPPMRVGGRRWLAIPPELAYGDTPPPGIDPGATLVFVVDLLDVGDEVGSPEDQSE